MSQIRPGPKGDPAANRPRRRAVSARPPAEAQTRPLSGRPQAAYRPCARRRFPVPMRRRAGAPLPRRAPMVSHRPRLAGSAAPCRSDAPPWQRRRTTTRRTAPRTPVCGKPPCPLNGTESRWSGAYREPRCGRCRCAKIRPPRSRMRRAAQRTSPRRRASDRGEVCEPVAGREPMTRVCMISPW